MKKIIIISLALILISSVYAGELQPGKLWINGVLIPYVEIDCFTDKCGDIVVWSPYNDPVRVDIDKGIFGDGIIDIPDMIEFIKYDGICKDDPDYDDKIDFDSDGCIRADETSSDWKCMIEWIRIDKTNCSLPPNYLEEEEGWETSYSIMLINDVPSFTTIGTKFDLEVDIQIIKKKYITERKFLPDKVYLLIEGNRINPSNENNPYQFIIDTSSLIERESPYIIYAAFMFEGKLYQEEIGQFIIDLEEHCLEVIPNHNNPDDESRMNIVFVGLGYSNIVVFKEYVDMSVSFDEEGYGIFSLEPFKSNKDKFNLWYVDRLDDLEGCKSIGTSSRSLNCQNVEGTRTRARKLSSICHFSNKVTSSLLNAIFRSHAGWDLSETSFIETDNIEKNEKNTRIVIHEFGHLYGHLMDEYFHVMGNPSSDVYDREFREMNCFSKGLLGEKDSDCEHELNYCIEDEYCVLGCDPIDIDCIIDPSCNEGDGCSNYECEIPDPDCNNKKIATIEAGDLCVKEEVEESDIRDPDCSKNDCNEDGICISFCIENGERGLDPDCLIKTCNEGNGCVVGCVNPDIDCGERYCEIENPDHINCEDEYCNDRINNDICMPGCLYKKCGGIDGNEPTCAEGDGCKGGCSRLMTKEECYSEAQWRDLLGKGCGNDDKDCIIGYSDGLAICSDNSFDCFLEIDCWQGCSYTPYNFYRATFNSIMKAQNIDPYSYGLVNERLICQRIRDNVGLDSTQLGDTYCTPNFGI